MNNTKEVELTVCVLIDNSSLPN